MAKTVKTFKVTLRVPGDRFDAIMQAVGRGDYVLSGCEEIAGAEAPQKTVTYFAGGKKNKGIKGDDLLLSWLATGSASSDVLRDVFRERGFKDTSLSPVLSKAKEAGLILGNYKGWALTAKGKEAASMVTSK